MSEKIFRDHKNKLLSAMEEEAQPEECLTEVLLSLRVNALQIPPEQRRSFVQQIIQIDIFKITQLKSMDFIMQMLNMDNHGLKHSLSALLSVIVSTAQGIQYVTHSEPNKLDLQVLEKVIAILKEQEDGSVTQRFQIAVLQKMSAQNSTQLDEGVTESIIELMVKK